MATESQSIMYIVTLAKRGTDVSDTAKWKYVSAVTFDGSDISEFEFSQDIRDAKHFSRFTAQDLCKAMPDRFYAYRQRVKVQSTPTEVEIAAADPLANLAVVYADGIGRQFRIKAPKDCKSARYCKVTFNRRSIVLQNANVSDKAISGVTLDGELTTIFIRKGVTITPLATSCEGELVAVKFACTCNNGAALAVEHSKGWAA